MDELYKEFNAFLDLLQFDGKQLIDKVDKVIKAKDNKIRDVEVCLKAILNNIKFTEEQQKQIDEITGKKI